jgi:hypothetical protein
MKYIVYLVNGCDETVYDLTRDGNTYTAYRDKNHKKKVQWSSNEVNSYIDEKEIERYEFASRPHFVCPYAHPEYSEDLSRVESQCTILNISEERCPFDYEPKTDCFQLELDEIKKVCEVGGLLP